MTDMNQPPLTFTLRHDLKPGDLGAIVSLHGTLYAREYGFNPIFEAYVAGPLAEFVCSPSNRARLWIAERDKRIVGCVAVVSASETEAQLRWFLVDPAARGLGLGKRLLREAIEFSRGCGYETIFLWTANVLTTAARLYQDTGFEKVEEKAADAWGVEVVEERYVLRLGASGG
jgi:ribosomal protein S18 acetylase RimI-like enzyme